MKCAACPVNSWADVRFFLAQALSVGLHDFLSTNLVQNQNVTLSNSFHFVALDRRSLATAEVLLPKTEVLHDLERVLARVIQYVSLD